MSEPRLPTVEELERFEAALERLEKKRWDDLYYEITGTMRVTVTWVPRKPGNFVEYMIACGLWG